MPCSSHIVPSAAGSTRAQPPAVFPYHRALSIQVPIMRFDLKVPFAEKDAAKKLGARWDAANKLWYVVDKDPAPFEKWSPTPRDPAAPSQPATPAVPRRATTRAPASSEGIRIVGSQYVARPRVCDCLPWEVCDTCRATAYAW